MNGLELLEKINKLEIANGTIFNVLNESNETIGRIGVIEKNITFLNFENIPENLYSTKYKFVVDK